MKRLLVLILALAMIFSASGEAFAVDSYSEYFSAEREFTVVDNALDYSTYLYSDEETGYLYSRNVDTKEERLIYDKNVTNHYVWNGSIYCVVDGNSIVKITASGSNPETILTTEKDIDRLYVNDDLIFYQMDNAIYRYYIESGATDCIVEADYIYFFYPYSNFVVEWGIGDSVVYRVDTSAVNSVDSSGTSNTTTLDGYTFIKEIDVQAAAAVTVHGKRIPVTSYSDGTYYTKNGKACKKVSAGGCHDNKTYACTYTKIGTCPNCKDYNGLGVQCMGFAYYIYNYIWNIPINKDDKNETEYNTSTEPDARSVLWNIPSGTHVRVSGPETSGHSIIITNVTQAGVSIYHANGDGTCKVQHEFLSFQNYAKKYSKIKFTYDAAHSFKTTYSFDDRIHWYPCTASSCNAKGSIAYHSFFTNSQGKFQCSGCGYVSNTSTNTLPNSIG